MKTEQVSVGEVKVSRDVAKNVPYYVNLVLRLLHKHKGVVLLSRSHVCNDKALQVAYYVAYRELAGKLKCDIGMSNELVTFNNKVKNGRSKTVQLPSLKIVLTTK